MDQSAALPAEMIAAETAGDNPKIVNDPASGASWAMKKVKIAIT